MQCSRCGSDNPQAALSCISCGQLLSGAGAHGAAARTVPSPQEFGLRGYREDWSAPGVAVSGENTSGRGDGYPLPAGISGWTFAGLAPFGLFALYNGLQAWGVAGLLLNALAWPLYIVYALYIGLEGRALAWRQRRFASFGEFERTMRVWSIAGLIMGIIGAALFVLWLWYFMSVMLALPADGFVAPGCST